MVNTFLLFASIEASVRFLDNKRLGKQRVEAYQARALYQAHLHPRARAVAECIAPRLGNALQIWRILVGAAQGRGWRAHPAIRAWEGHADALASYTNACIDEWLRRGFRNTMQRLPVGNDAPAMPWWFGFAPFHYSHRASLLRKDAAHYAAAFAAAAAEEAAAAGNVHGDAGDDTLVSFVPMEYRELGYVWPHAVPAELRGAPHASAARGCCVRRCRLRRDRRSRAARHRQTSRRVLHRRREPASQRPRRARCARNVATWLRLLDVKESVVKSTSRTRQPSTALSMRCATRLLLFHCVPDTMWSANNTFTERSCSSLSDASVALTLPAGASCAPSEAGCCCSSDRWCGCCPGEGARKGGGVRKRQRARARRAGRRNAEVQRIAARRGDARGWARRVQRQRTRAAQRRGCCDARASQGRGKGERTSCASNCAACSCSCSAPGAPRAGCATKPPPPPCGSGP